MQSQQKSAAESPKPAPTHESREGFIEPASGATTEFSKATFSPILMPLSKLPRETTGLDEILGVTNRMHQEWQTQCKNQLQLIGTANIHILNRPLHRAVAELEKSLQAIVKNCDHDPDDIREEIALPAILKRLALVVAGCPALAFQALRSSAAYERLNTVREAIENMTGDLNELLNRMRSNDGVDIVTRARVLSRVFSRPNI